MTFLQRRFDDFPDLLSLHRLDPQRYPFLLESVCQEVPSDSGVSRPPRTRWDILFAFPGQRLELGTGGIIDTEIPGFTAADRDFLDCLDDWWGQESEQAGDTSLPFTGGWFIYLGYELAAQIEPVLHLPEIKQQCRPQAMAVRCPAAILRDHEARQIIVIAEAGHDAYLDLMQADLQRCIDGEHMPETGNAVYGGAGFSFTDFLEEADGRFLDAIPRIKDYIHDGDVFQVNLSRRWRGSMPGRCASADIYHSLRTHNPAPFAGLCVQPDWAIISSSPERLVYVDRLRHVETRPIAGTHRRHHDREHDNRLSQALLEHPKERAEHIMLIDMERNDLGRVCKPGSVEVNELMILESYPHVHHLVSNVRGRLRDEVTPGDIIRAVFPGGTITGCPKVRCMEIIAELEQDERGPYTGSMGYLNRDGSLDLNILIRTLVVNGQELSLRAGAGIVADSVPARELEETRAKARGLLAALEDL